MLPPNLYIPPIHVRSALIGLALGLVAGIFLGWTFSGAFGFVFRMMLTLMLLVPLALALVFWLRVNQRNREERTDIRDAEWHDLNKRR